MKFFSSAELNFSGVIASFSSSVDMSLIESTQNVCLQYEVVILPIRNSYTYEHIKRNIIYRVNQLNMFIYILFYLTSFLQSERRYVIAWFSIDLREK